MVERVENGPELVSGRDRARPAARPATVPKLCRQCLGHIPAPRRTVCSAACAQKRKLALQDYQRRRAREK